LGYVRVRHHLLRVLVTYSRKAVQWNSWLPNLYLYKIISILMPKRVGL
jgi:hypothetical protein